MSAEPTYPAPPATRIRISLPYRKQLLLGYFIPNDRRKLTAGLGTLGVISGEHAWAHTLVMRAGKAEWALGNAFSTRVLAACQFCFNFTNAGMDSRWVFSGSKLVEELFILVHDAVPVIELADPVRSAPAVVFGQLGPILNQLDLRGQVCGVSKQESVAGQDFSAERIVMRQNAVAKAERLKERRVCSTHHMPMNICVRITVKLFDVFNAVNMPQEAHSFVGSVLELIDKRAAIIRISGNGKQAFRPGLLEAFHNQRSVVFRHQPA